MLDWKSDAERELAESASAAGFALEAARAAEMFGEWPDGTVMRVAGTDARAVWLWRSVRDGSLICAAVAPWGSVWDCDHVPAAEFFASVVPPDWTTKLSAGLARKGWEAARSKEPDWRGVAWAVALLRVPGSPRSRHARLFRVAETDAAGKLYLVQASPDEPPVRAEGYGAARWIPQDAWPIGYERLWHSGDTLAGSYMWHVIKAHKAQEGRKAKLPKRER